MGPMRGSLDLITGNQASSGQAAGPWEIVPGIPNNLWSEQHIISVQAE